MRRQVLKYVLFVWCTYIIYTCVCVSVFTVYVTLIWTVEMNEDQATCGTYSFNIDVTANWILTAESIPKENYKRYKVVEHMQLSLHDKLSLHQHTGSYNTCVLCMYVCVYRSVNLVRFKRLEMFLGKFVIRKFDFQTAQLIDLSIDVTSQFS